MPQSLACILVHGVFSTKHRTPWLVDLQVRHELHAYMTTTLQSLECWPSAVDGVADHVHFLCLLSRKIRVMDLIEEVKTSSSKWIKTKGSHYHDFYWQAGYGAFSVSESMRSRVISYINRQEEHHRVQTFQEEYRMLCKLHGVEIDEALCLGLSANRRDSAPLQGFGSHAPSFPRPAAWAVTGRPVGPQSGDATTLSTRSLCSAWLQVAHPLLTILRIG